MVRPRSFGRPPATAPRMAVERVLGAENVHTTEPTMGGEDFAYFANRVPGVYFRLGVLAPGTESGAIHTPEFRADDGAVPVGMEAMAHLVVGYLTRPQGRRGAARGKGARLESRERGR